MEIRIQSQVGVFQEAHKLDSGFQDELGVSILSSSLHFKISY